MKIYTKAGDQGETGLFGGARVPKDDLRVRVYGTLDELNCQLGVLVSSAKPADWPKGSSRVKLEQIQSWLFQLGAELATPRGKSNSIVMISDKDTKDLELAIDEMEAYLPVLRTFILPGGNVLSSYTHLARAICRRAERELTTLHRAEPVRAEAQRFLNRLSDYFFVLARAFNSHLKADETLWQPDRVTKK